MENIDGDRFALRGDIRNQTFRVGTNVVSTQRLFCIHPCILIWSPVSCPVASGGYRTEGQDAGMDTEITGEWSYYPILIVSIPVLTLLSFKYT